MNWSHYVYTDKEQEEFLIKLGYQIKEKTIVSEKFSFQIKQVYKDDILMPERLMNDNNHVSYTFYNILKEWLLEQIIKDKIK